MTTQQTLDAFAVLAVVLEAARTYPDYQVVYEGETYRWGTEEQMVVDISPGLSGRLLWGDIMDTAIAVQIFLSEIPCTTYVRIHEDDEAKIYLGELLLSVSTSTVSSS